MLSGASPGLLVVTESDRKARYLVVQGAKARIGRTVESLRVEVDRRFEIAACFLAQGQSAETALGARVTALDDALPDQGLRSPRVLPSQVLARFSSASNAFLRSPPAGVS